MRVEVVEEPLTAFQEYGRVSIAFEVRSVLEVVGTHASSGGFVLNELRVADPYVKDYDAIEGEEPARWASRFDVSNWGLLAARAEGRRVGGAVVAFDTPGLEMLEGRRDLAVLWDIRVSPEARGLGVGSALFRAAEAWAAARGCRRLKVETQNINVPACRFYERHGCVLVSANAHAYPSLPDEIQLLWQKDISR